MNIRLKQKCPMVVIPVAGNTRSRVDRRRGRNSKKKRQEEDEKRSVMAQYLVTLIEYSNREPLSFIIHRARLRKRKIRCVCAKVLKLHTKETYVRTYK